LLKKLSKKLIKNLVVQIFRRIFGPVIKTNFMRFIFRNRTGFTPPFIAENPGAGFVLSERPFSYRRASSVHKLYIFPEIKNPCSLFPLFVRVSASFIFSVASYIYGICRGPKAAYCFYFDVAGLFFVRILHFRNNAI
jgi:hypothetical protein